METIASMSASKEGCEGLVKEGGIGIFISLALGTNTQNRSKALQCLAQISGSINADDTRSFGPLLNGGIVECFTDVVESSKQTLANNPNPNESSSSASTTISSNTTDIQNALTGLANLMQSVESVPDTSPILDDLALRLVDSSSITAILNAAKKGNDDEVFRALALAANVCRRSVRMRSTYEKELLALFTSKLMTTSPTSSDGREDDTVVFALRGVRELACKEPLKIGENVEIVRRQVDTSIPLEATILTLLRNLLRDSLRSHSNCRAATAILPYPLNPVIHLPTTYNPDSHSAWVHPVLNVF